MNKEHFNSLVANYSDLKSQSGDLENLVDDYPYSQPVRMLYVKSLSSSSKEEFQKRLSLAAFYTTDRNVLRGLIEKGKVPSELAENPKSTKPRPKVNPPKSSAKKPSKEDSKKSGSKPILEPQVKRRVIPKARVSNKTNSNPSVIDAAKLRSDVMANLALLQKTKHDFLKISELEREIKPKKVKEVEIKTTPTQQKVKPQNPKKSPTIKNKESESPTSVELIDKFIADKPSISRGKALKDNQSDLSKSSSKLKEDLVSENLAIIFAKQGKVNKAIDIYKKLIWKFPQKKASFAARIEELKKKK